MQNTNMQMFYECKGNTLKTEEETQSKACVLFLCLWVCRRGQPSALHFIVALGGYSSGDGE